MSSNIKMAAVDPDTATDQRQLFLLVFPPIMLPIFLAVVDSTIVTTALPAMAASFGEVQRISWVVVGYLLANTIAAPVYGRLADMFGRRQLMQMAIGLFCAASVVCALSTSLPMLVLARVLQGLGGGGLMTLSQALIGERVPARQRGHFQGYLAAVIVFASTFGPVAGGFLTEAFGWPSVFWVNLPVGFLAMALVRRLPQTNHVGSRASFDGLGLVWLVLCIVPLLLGLDQMQRLGGFASATDCRSAGGRGVLGHCPGAARAADRGATDSRSSAARSLDLAGQCDGGVFRRVADGAGDFPANLSAGGRWCFA